jgi:hypothetical protein
MMKQIAGSRRWLVILVAVLMVYLAAAYVILPALWSHHEHEPGLASLPMVTRTGSGIPGDALNVGLVGSKEDILRAMHAAGWFPADPITLRSSIEIVGSVVLDRPYHDAPVSPLYYEGKKNSSLSKSPTAGAQTGDIMSVFGWCLKRELTAVRSGSVQLRSTVAWA